MVHTNTVDENTTGCYHTVVDLKLMDEIENLGFINIGLLYQFRILVVGVGVSDDSALDRYFSKENVEKNYDWVPLTKILITM